ncbi:MAG: hypothetical protein Q9157_001368 [Trypethelium eluteriae]
MTVPSSEDILWVPKKKKGRRTKADRLLHWLSEENPLIRQRHLRSIRATDTGQWFLKSPKLRNWVVNDGQTLFCPGVPGSGKSVVTSMVVDRLFDTFGDQTDIGIAIFYCNYHQDQKQSQLLRSLLKQLGGRLPSLPTILLDLYRDQSTRPSKEKLFDVLRSMSTSLSKVYIVIDALDELPSPTRDAFLSNILVLQSESNVNLFATSRSFSEIVSKFMGVPSLEINGTANDLIRFIDQSQRELLGSEIKESIVKVSYGMKVTSCTVQFSLARLQLQELRPETPFRAGTKLAYYNTTSNFIPECPGDFWETNFGRIQVLPKEQREAAKKVLAWLTFAKRSLKAIELWHAFGVKNGSTRYDETNALDIGEIVAICQGFVAYVGTDDIFTLVHFSARNYLQVNQHKCGLDTNETIATCCINCLSFDAFCTGFCGSDEEFESRLRMFPFCRYAAQHWGDHLDEQILSLFEQEVCSFLMDQARVAFASQTMFASGDGQLQPGYSQKVTRQITGLHLAASFGSTPVIKLLLAKGQKIAAKDSQGRTPLWCATEKDHGEAMKLLSLTDRTTFTTMVTKGEKTLARRLLEEAGPHIKGLRLRTALHIGVLHNDLDIMESALSNGVNIDSKDGDGSTPIQLAFRERKTEAVDFLLNDTADAEVTDITVDDWLQVYGFNDSHVVELSKKKAGHKMRCPQDTLLEFKRSLIQEEQLYRHSMIATIPVQTNTTEEKLFTLGQKEMRIAWTMQALPDSRGKNCWTSQDHFSTLPTSSIPESGAAFFQTLIRYVMRGWLELYQSIEGHLTRCRRDILVANGREPDLIVRLLKDANTWIDLRRLLHNQVEVAQSFRLDYDKYGYEDSAIDDLAETIEEFARTIHSRIDKLDESSSTLVQLEFNLTSIREAQKSTTLNRSIKRLTWINGLFGMNVDVLAMNPPWWWYLVFAVATLGLTLTVWIVFKRYRTLEDKVEIWFTWLVGPRKSQDIERGLLPIEDKKIK